MFDPKLQLTVAENIEKAVGLFVAKVEGKFLNYKEVKVGKQIHRFNKLGDID